WRSAWCPHRDLHPETSDTINHRVGCNVEYFLWTPDFLHGRQVHLFVARLVRDRNILVRIRMGQGFILWRQPADPRARVLISRHLAFSESHQTWTPNLCHGG